MRLFLKLGIALAILTVSTMAFAGTVSVQFNNANGSPTWGNDYAYPYHGSVNGAPEDFMCISYDNPISGGQSWPANVYTVAQYQAQVYTGSDPLFADRLALLFTYAEASHLPDINAAAWYLNGGSLSIAGTSAQGWYDLAMSRTVFPETFSNVRFFVPTAVNNAPQTFMGDTPTPEPSTLLMMGSGLLGLAGLARKRLFS